MNFKQCYQYFLLDGPDRWIFIKTALLSINKLVFFYMLCMEAHAYMGSTKFNPSYLGVGVYHPNQTLNTEFFIAGEPYTGLCLAIFNMHTINSSVH